MKKLKKKKKLIISKDFQKKLNENINYYGMEPYDAACVAGVDTNMSPRQIKLIAQELQDRKHLDLVFKNGIDNIAARNYASLDCRMRRLSQKGGLWEHKDIKGWQRIVKSGESFVEVDDAMSQNECIKEINRMTRTTGSTGDTEEGPDDKTINVRIILTSNQGTKPLPNNSIPLKSNPARSNTDEY